MDATQKKMGVPFSTSRKEEKKMKHRTQRARRREGKEETADCRSLLRQVDPNLENYLDR